MQTKAAICTGALLLLGLSLAGTSAFAVQVPVGPRAVALGGAFSSIANDATALFWNPAGLVRVDNQELSINYADLFGTGIKDYFGVYAVPFSRRSVTAFDVYHSGFDDGELGFGETRFDVATAYGTERLSGGVVVKYIRRGVDLDGSSVSDGGGFGIDLGLLISPVRGWSLGLVGQDLFDTRISYAKTGTSTRLEQTLRASTSYAFGRLGTLAFDIDDQYHGGIEVTPLDVVALRAGVRKDREGDADPISAFGAGLKAGVINVNYAFESHPTLGETHHVGISLEYSLNPPLLRIESVDAPAVYASLYPSYAVTPFGTAMVTNLKDEPLPVTLRVRLSGLMENYSEIDTLLRPGQTTPIPLTAVLSEDLLNLTGDRRTNVEVEAEYTSLRVTRKDRSVGRCDVFAPGAINWARGTDQAAAYVTVGDPLIQDFANDANRVGMGVATGVLGRSSFAKVASVADALATLDIAYVEDPLSPYSSISRRETIDTVRYPRETLRRLSGDCDDTTVLMAALLGTMGIRTQFVDAPGHLFLLFETGVHESRLGELGLPEELFATSNESVWVPLETTALRSGFARAWILGAAEYQSWRSQGDLRLVDVFDAQSRYVPITAPNSPGLVPRLDSEAVRRRLRADVAIIDSIGAEYRNRNSGVALDIARLQQAARERYAAGEFEEASVILLQILRVRAEDSRVHNNLGTVYLKMGQPNRAVEAFERALDLDPNDPGITLNLGLALRAKGDEAGALRTLRDGIRRAGGYEQARTMLGILPGPGALSGITDGDGAALQLVRDALTGRGGETGKGAPAGSGPALYWAEIR